MASKRPIQQQVSALVLYFTLADQTIRDPMTTGSFELAFEEVLKRLPDARNRCASEPPTYPMRRFLFEYFDLALSGPHRYSRDYVGSV